MKKNKFNKWGSILAFIILLIIVIISNIPNSSSNFNNIMSKIFTPVQNLLVNIKNSIFNKDEAADIKSLQDINKKLFDENVKLKEKLREFEVIKADNDKLKEFFNIKNKYINYETVPATIIQKNISNYEKTVIINSGVKDGVGKNMPVISSDGIVGYIVEAYENTSKVKMIIDTSSTISANISTSEDSILVKGQLGKNNLLKAIYIPVDSTILQGDEVLTSGIGGIYPKGIMVGKIKEVVNTKNESDKYAVIETAVNMDKLESVLVIKK